MAKCKSIYLSETLSITDSLEGQADICRDMGFSKSTLIMLWANRSKARAAVLDGSTSSSRKKIRMAKYKDIDEAVYRWFLNI